MPIDDCWESAERGRKHSKSSRWNWLGIKNSQLFSRDRKNVRKCCPMSSSPPFPTHEEKASDTFAMRPLLSKPIWQFSKFGDFIESWPLANNFLRSLKRLKSQPFRIDVGKVGRNCHFERKRDWAQMMLWWGLTILMGFRRLQTISFDLAQRLHCLSPNGRTTW